MKFNVLNIMWILQNQMILPFQSYPAFPVDIDRIHSNTCIRYKYDNIIIKSNLFFSLTPIKSLQSYHAFM